MAGPLDFCAGCSVGWEACLGAYWAAEDDCFGCYAPNWYDLNAEKIRLYKSGIEFDL